MRELFIFIFHIHPFQLEGVSLIIIHRNHLASVAVVKWMIIVGMWCLNNMFGGYKSILLTTVNTLRPRQDGRHFADDIFKCIFLNENVWIPIEMSLKFVSKGPINNISAMVQIMAWRRPGDKLLSEPMVVSLATHICQVRYIAIYNLKQY